MNITEEAIHLRKTLGEETLLTYDGRTMSVKQWADRAGMMGPGSFWIRWARHKQRTMTIENLFRDVLLSSAMTEFDTETIAALPHDAEY